MQVAADAELIALVNGAGVDAVPLGSDPHGADVLVLGGVRAWGRLRAWREGGARVPAIVVADEAPADRDVHEPVYLLREATRRGVEAALRSTSAARAAPNTPLAGGTLVDRRFQCADGREVGLTPLEVRLLAYLASRVAHAVDRDELQEQVWDHKQPLVTKAVDMAVMRLRKKIEPDPTAPITLLSASRGYRVAPAHQARGVPALSGPLIGRDAIVAELAGLLESRRAPIALVGLPGVGKSRVAREVASRLAGRGVRVVFADLDSLADASPALALAAALDVDLPQDGEPMAGLVDALAGAVVMLDHAEQRPDVAQALGAAALGRFALLIASQVVLPIAELDVRSLPLLDEDASAQLLLDRTGGALDPSTARALASALDGLPLALVLAAGRVGLLGAEAMLEESEAHRLALLSPEGAGRHGSLGLAVRSTLARLPEPAAAALSALTVFRAPFRLGDARAVLGADAVLHLAALAERGVLARDGDRYRILHAIRAAVPPAPPSIALRHRAWAAERAAVLSVAIAGFEAQDAWTEFAWVHADLRAALPGAVADRDATAAAELALGIDRATLRSEPDRDRLAMLDGALPAVDADPFASARVRHRRGVLMSRVDRPRGLREIAAAADALVNVAPDASGRARVDYCLAAVVVQPRDALAAVLEAPADVATATRLRLDAAELLAREALGEVPLARAAAELERITAGLVAEGALADSCNVGLYAAHRLLAIAPERALPFIQQLRTWVGLARLPWMAANLRRVHGLALTAFGAYADARAELAEALAIVDRLRPGVGVDFAHSCAWVELEAGELDQARALLEGLLARSGGRHPAAEAQAHVDLVAVELDAGRIDAATARARDCTAAAERFGGAHFRAEGEVQRAVAAILAGEPLNGRRILRDVDPGQLTTPTRLLALTAAAVAGRAIGEPDPNAEGELDRAVTESRWPNAEALRIVLRAGRAGQPPRELPRPAGVDVRLMRRLWASVA